MSLSDLGPPAPPAPPARPSVAATWRAYGTPRMAGVRMPQEADK